MDSNASEIGVVKAVAEKYLNGNLRLPQLIVQNRMSFCRYHIAVTSLALQGRMVRAEMRIPVRKVSLFVTIIIYILDANNFQILKFSNGVIVETIKVDTDKKHIL